MTETDTSRERVETLARKMDFHAMQQLEIDCANTLRALLARAEKAEAECDTAWNDAIEAAAKYHDHFLMVKTGIDIEQVISSTEAIRALKKGEPT